MFAWQVQCSPVASPGLGDAVLAGMDGDPARRVDDPDLAHGGQLVGRSSAAQRRLRASPAASRSSACGPCAGSTTDCVATAPAGARPRAERADGEPVRLDRRAVLPGLGIEGDDRVRP